MITLEKPGLALGCFTNAALILPQLHNRASTAVMQELAETLHRQEPAVPARRFRNMAALMLELLTGMSLDFGAAFPQVIVPELKRARFALGRSLEPLPRRAARLPPVHLVFLIAGPSKSHVEYQQLVAALLRLGKDAARLGQLQVARDAGEMLAALEQTPLITTEGRLTLAQAAVPRPSEQFASFSQLRPLGWRPAAPPRQHVARPRG